MSKSYFINIPPNLDKVMAENWRTVKSALNEHTILNSAVHNPSSGLTAGSKVKISSGDSTSDYLNLKLIGGTGITFTKSLTGGVGSEILTASIGTHGNLSNMPDTGGTNTDHDTRYVAKVQAATPTTPTPFPGMIWRDTDAVNNFSLGFAVVDDTYTVADEIELVVCNKATAFTVTLPTASGSGRWLYIKNINTGTVTISLAGDTIDGSASQAIYQWECATLVDYAANSWVIV